MPKKNQKEWVPVGEPHKLSGVVISSDIHKNPYFQARYTIMESRVEDGVTHMRSRDVLGEPVYSFGEHGSREIFEKHPDFYLSTQVLKALWPTIQAVTDEFSKVRG